MKSFEEMFEWHPVERDGMPKTSGYYWIKAYKTKPYVSYYSPDYSKRFQDCTHTIAWAGRLEIDDYREQTDV